jgi:hypothetical protein
MENEPLQRLARIERGELAALGSEMPLAERGGFLRDLLQLRGIDTDRLYRVEYFPTHHCWLVTQDAGAAGPRRPGAASRGPKADELFYVQAIADFQRVARAAYAAMAAHSMHFARFGRKYELPEPERELPLSDLVDLLRDTGDETPPVRFDSEGRWRHEPRS